jgi:protein-S-isoprenylcysteine O-methyltransferase Ste14
MGNTSRDPIDHARTTRQHAGETMKNGYNVPGLVLMAVGVVALVISMAAFATGHSTEGSVAATVAAVLLLGGGLWLMLTHRRVRRRELQWAAHHPDADLHPPAS